MKVLQSALAQVANQTQAANKQGLAKPLPIHNAASVSANNDSTNPEKVAEGVKTRHEPESHTKKRHNNNKQEQDRQPGNGKHHKKIDIIA